MNQDSFETLTRPQGGTIAYVRTPGRGPGVIFLPGFRSDMNGGKALALEAQCRTEGRAFLRFDYSGHGRSSGRLTDGTIGGWRDDVLAVLDRLSEGRQILVGSSMGGWLMLLAALARPNRIAGLVGVAAAPDFASRLMERGLDAASLAALRRDGIVLRPSLYSPEPTPITLKLVEDAKRHELLGGTIDIRCPVRLLHGMSDPDVPWGISLELADRLASNDVEILLIKSGDHRLSNANDLARLCAIVRSLCQQAELR